MPATRDGALMDTRRIPPLVGPPARAAILRAQRLNADIDASLEPEDERRALRLWRPLARRYPDDLATMHGYVLALARGTNPDSVGPQILPEFLDAAQKLLAMDETTSDAASHAATACYRCGRAFGDAALLERAVELHGLAGRRAGRDRSSAAWALMGQARAYAALGKPRLAAKFRAAATKRDPRLRHFPFDEDD